MTRLPRSTSTRGVDKFVHVADPLLPYVASNAVDHLDRREPVVRSVTRTGSPQVGRRYGRDEMTERRRLPTTPRADQLAGLVDRIAPGTRVVRTRRLPGGLSCRMDMVEVEREDGERRKYTLRRFASPRSTPERVEIEYRSATTRGSVSSRLTTARRTCSSITPASTVRVTARCRRGRRSPTTPSRARRAPRRSTSRRSEPVDIALQRARRGGTQCSRSDAGSS